MAVYLETERLTLREITEDDVEAVLALHTDPAVMRYLAPVPTATESEIRGWIASLEAFRATPGFGYWAVIERAGGEFLGWFLFRPPRVEHPVPGEVELGYRLTRASWGRGIATEGARALVAKGFADAGVKRVVAYTMVINSGSRRVMEKVGLRHVDTVVDPDSAGIDGAEHGDVVYALTRAEWAASAHA